MIDTMRRTKEFNCHFVTEIENTWDGSDSGKDLYISWGNQKKREGLESKQGGSNMGQGKGA